MASSVLPLYHPYKSRAPRYGERYNNGVIPVVTGQLSAAIFGDSISEDDTFGGTGVFSTTGTFNIGHVPIYSDLANNKFKINPLENLANAGESTVDLVARLSDLDTISADTIFNMFGINDVKNLEASLASVVSRCAAIFNYECLVLGKRAVAISVLPNANWQVGWTSDGSTGKIDLAKVKIKAINRFLAKLHSLYGGKLIYIDAYTSVADTGSTPVDNPKANMTFDNIHENNYGSFTVADAMRDVLDAFFPPLTLPDFTTGLLANGTMTGTGGTAGSGFTGDVANSWTVSGTGGVGTRVASKVSGKQQLEMNLVGAASFDNMQMSQTIASGFSSGDVVYAQALVEVIGTPVNIYGNQLLLKMTGSGLPTTTEAYSMKRYDGAFVAVYPAPNPIAETYLPVGQYLMTTTDLLVGGTGVSLECRYDMHGRNTIETKTGTVQVTAAQIFKR